MRFSCKFLSFCFAAFMTISSISFVQADDFDVHGRDMTYPRLPQSLGNFMGHVGIEFRGRVYNMLPGYSRNSYSGESQLKATGRQDFIWAHPNYWGARNAGDIYERGTTIRVLETYFYGAKYTYYAGYNSAYKSTRNGRTIYVRGKYRCDTFVASSLRAGGFNVGRISSPLTTFYRLPNRS